MNPVRMLIAQALVIACASMPLFANEENAPNASFGVMMHAGYHSAWHRAGSGTAGGNGGYGGGIVLEKMFNNTLGLHSGVQFTYFSINGSMSGSVLSPSIGFKMNSYAVEFPLCLMTSINAENFSFVFLTGFTFMQIVASRVETGNIYNVSYTNTNMLPYISSSHAGMTAGLILKARVSRYNDFILGVTATLYLTDLLQRTDGSIVHLYNIRVLVGYLYRTNLFPIQ